MRRRRCERCRLWPLAMELNRMLVNMVMQLKRESRVCVVVWDMVVQRGGSIG